MSEAVRCRTSRREDLPALARCHARAFPHALSTRQGPRFVRKMLEWYVVSPRGVLFHVESGGEVVGYCGGVRNEPGEPGAFTSISQYAFWTFAGSVALRPWLLFDPDNRRRWHDIGRNVLIRFGLRRPVPLKEVPHRGNEERHWGLVVIGVDPAHEGRGHGSVLLREFEQRARADGVRFVRLSVRRVNERAIAAYERNGWVAIEQNEMSQVMEKKDI